MRLLAQTGSMPQIRGCRRAKSQSSTKAGEHKGIIHSTRNDSQKTSKFLQRAPNYTLRTNYRCRGRSRQSVKRRGIKPGCVYIITSNDKIGVGMSNSCLFKYIANLKGWAALKYKDEQ
eukprot:100799_1